MGIRSGIQDLCDIPGGAAVVGITEFRGQLFVALSTGVWRLEAGVLVPVEFAEVQDEAES